MQSRFRHLLLPILTALFLVSSALPVLAQLPPDTTCRPRRSRRRGKTPTITARILSTRSTTR